MTHKTWLLMVCLAVAGVGCGNKKSFVNECDEVLTRAMACTTRACVQDIDDHDVKKLFDEGREVGPDDLRYLFEVRDRVHVKLAAMSKP
jgi:hypothetical protein